MVCVYVYSCVRFMYVFVWFTHASVFKWFTLYGLGCMWVMDVCDLVTSWKYVGRGVRLLSGCVYVYMCLYLCYLQGVGIRMVCVSVCVYVCLCGLWLIPRCV